LLISEWDKKINSNSEKLLQLHQQVQNVMQSQSELDQNLTIIIKKQEGLETTLAYLERELEKLDNQPTEIDKERLEAYSQADKINKQLDQIEKQLRELVDRLNYSQQSQDQDNPVSQIVTVLNAHLHSMQWVDQNISSLQEKINEVDRMYKAQKKSPPRIQRVTSFENVAKL